MYEDLKIIHWPDPRLIKPSKPVEAFNQELHALAARMFELMRESRGVGLAAPQVGENLRMFVINPTGQAEDDRVYVNPVLSDAADEEEGEEGCLSLPGINLKVVRAKAIHIAAQDLDGQRFEESHSGYIARICQHETDHLNGKLLVNYMGPVARMANRQSLRKLEAEYSAAHPAAKPRAKAALR